MNRDYGGVIPPRGDDQPRSRNALSDAYCENYWPLQGRLWAGSAASQALDASSANRLARANCETRQTQCQLLERVIDSPRALFPQLHNWHTTIVRAGAQKDVVRRTRPDMSRVWTMALCAIGKHHEKFGTAEAKRGVPALGCCAFAALNEAVSPSEIAKVSRQVSWLRYLARREKADLRQSRSCSDCSSRRACWIGA
jgi:hypothetical protein